MRLDQRVGKAWLVSCVILSFGCGEGHDLRDPFQFRCAAREVSGTQGSKMLALKITRKKFEMQP